MLGARGAREGARGERAGRRLRGAVRSLFGSTWEAAKKEGRRRRKRAVLVRATRPFAALLVAWRAGWTRGASVGRHTRWGGVLFAGTEKGATCEASRSRFSPHPLPRNRQGSARARARRPRGLLFAAARVQSRTAQAHAREAGGALRNPNHPNRPHPRAVSPRPRLPGLKGRKGGPIASRAQQYLPVCFLANLPFTGRRGAAARSVRARARA